MIVKIIVVIILIIKVVVILVIILNLDNPACSVQQVWVHPGVAAYQVQHLHLMQTLKMCFLCFCITLKVYF